MIHTTYLAYPTCKLFRLSVLGQGNDVVRSELLATGLGMQHPKPRQSGARATVPFDHVLILRSAFWQARPLALARSGRWEMAQTALCGPRWRNIRPWPRTAKSQTSFQMSLSTLVNRHINPSHIRDRRPTVATSLSLMSTSRWKRLIGKASCTWPFSTRGKTTRVLQRAGTRPEPWTSIASICGKCMLILMFSACFVASMNHALPILSCISQR